MPSPVIDYTKNAQSKTLDAITQSQAAVLDVVETWAKAVEGSVQELPAIPVAASPDPGWRARGLAFHGLRHRLFGARS